MEIYLQTGKHDWVSTYYTGINCFKFILPLHFRKRNVPRWLLASAVTIYYRNESELTLTSVWDIQGTLDIWDTQDIWDLCDIGESWEIWEAKWKHTDWLTGLSLVVLTHLKGGVKDLKIKPPSKNWNGLSLLESFL